MYRTGKKTEIEQPKLAKAKPVIAPPPPPPPAPVIAPPPPPAPVAALPDPCEGISGVLDGVNFHSDSAELTGDSQLILNDVAYTLRDCSNAQIEVSAHTDSVGSEAYNQSLSDRRAESVASYLGARGINRMRLSPVAFGETSPIDTNETAEGRARNRRVELQVR